MTGGDAGFEMIRANDFAGRGRAEGEDAFFDESFIPLAPILMMETHDFTREIHAGTQTGRVEAHEREQGFCGRL